MPRRKPHRTGTHWALVAAGALVLAIIACNVSALAHQRRALAEAVASEQASGPMMVQLEHLGRCISLSTPISGGITAECMQRAELIEEFLYAGRYSAEARVASSIIDGAVHSAGYGGHVFSSRTGRVPAHPPKAHGLAHERIMPDASWAMLGTMAGTLLVILLVLVLVVAPLTGHLPLANKKMQLAAAISAALLCGLFILGTWVA